MGQGLDLAIQAERETAVSVSHQSDHYSIYKIRSVFPRRCRTLQRQQNSIGLIEVIPFRLNSE